MYFTKTLINSIERFFNLCFFKITKINLSDFSLKAQSMKLAEFKLFPFKIRLFFRLNVFCYKILNHQILPNFFDKLEFIPKSLTRSKKAYGLVKVPFEGTKHGLA